MKETLQNSSSRISDLKLACLGQFVSVLGDEIALVALLLRLHDSGSGERGVMTFLLCSAAPMILGARFAGQLVDRTDSRRLIVITSLTSAATCCALAFSETLLSICVLIIMLQSAQCIAGPTWQGLVPNLVAKEKIAESVARLQALKMIAGFLGVPLGGWLAGATNQQVPLAIDGATFLALALAGWRIRTRRNEPRSGKVVSERVESGLSVIRRESVVWPITQALIVLVVFSECINVVEVFLVRDSAGATKYQFGIVAVLQAGGLVVGSLAATRFRETGQRVVAGIVAIIGLAVTMLVCGTAPYLAVLMPLTFIAGLCVGVLNTSFSAIFATRIHESARGRTSASLNGCVRTGTIVALLLGGALGSSIGAERTYQVAGVGALIGAIGLAGQVLGRRAVRSAIWGDA